MQIECAEVPKSRVGLAGGEAVARPPSTCCDSSASSRARRGARRQRRSRTRAKRTRAGAALAVFTPAAGESAVAGASAQRVVAGQIRVGVRIERKNAAPD